jgi:hypothetical protein
LRRIPLAVLMIAFGGLPAGAAMAEQRADVFAELGGVQLLGQSPHYADFALGAFGIGEDISAAARIELRGGEKWWFFGLN